jgi:hypothetical protein
LTLSESERGDARGKVQRQAVRKFEFLLALVEEEGLALANAEVRGEKVK